MSRRRVFTEQEQNFIKSNLLDKGMTYCYKQLHTDWKNVADFIKDNNLKQKKTSKEWTDEEKQHIKDLYQQNYNYKDIAKIIHRTPRATERMMFILKLYKKWQKPGDRIGNFIILDIYKKENKTYVKAQCICGKIIEKMPYYLYNVMSCGCARIKLIKDRQCTHKLSNHRIYKIYLHVKSRCYNKNSDSYYLYGERGIKICQEWLDDFMAFYNWAINNGYDEKLSLDRIDVNGNYSPGNCRWATRKEQGNNKRTNVKIEAFGEIKTVQEWSEDSRCVVSAGTLARRIRHKWDYKKAIVTPIYDESITKVKKIFVWNRNRIKSEKHGLSDTRIYKLWGGMKRRCRTDEKNDHLSGYGGRGIKVCEEWNNSFLNFYKWAMKNGYQENLTLDRINNDGNYEPQNCRWTTLQEQGKNRRNVLKLTAFEETKTPREWLEDSRCSLHDTGTIYNRLKKGWSPERAISEPTNSNNRKETPHGLQ